MSWLRVDDGFAEHPKILALKTDQRRWTWVRILIYCARYRSPNVPQNIRTFIPEATSRYLDECVLLRLLNRGDDGSLTVHDWQDYQVRDATGKERQARYRAKHGKNGTVTGDVTEHVTSDVTRNAVPRARASRPQPTNPKAAAGTTPADADLDLGEQPAAAPLTDLLEELDTLGISGGLRLAAMQDPTRALACARKAITTANGNPAGYFRRLLESGETPTANGKPKTEHRNYDPPKDPASAIGRMIANGAIPDLETLDAELNAYPNITPTERDYFRQMIQPPTTKVEKQPDHSEAA